MILKTVASGLPRAVQRGQSSVASKYFGNSDLPPYLGSSYITSPMHSHPTTARVSSMVSRNFSILVFFVLCTLACLPIGHAQPGLASQRPVAPGVIYKQFTLSGPNTLDVLDVTLASPFITLETTRPDGLVKTTSQATDIDREGHRVIGSINADFFSFETGWPIGNQVVNGVIAKGVNTSYSHLAINANKRPYIDMLGFRGTVRSSAGSTYTVTQVNNDRAASTLAFYTTYRGSTTGTDGSGAECTVEFLDSPRAGDTLRAVVKTLGTGNMAIPSSGGVLSASSGAPATFLTANVHAGDTIRIFLGFNRPLKSIVQVLGGRGRFLAGGRNVTDSASVLEGISSSFTGVGHPRTFVGFNADTSHFFLCTVDGRQSSSIGMTFAEMANFMISLGATDAFNFDGGGSTTMAVRGEIVNSPSDPAGERSVANALHVISTAPPGILHYLSASPDRAELFQGDTRQFTATGADEYYNPIAIPADAVWEADPAIGMITSSGFFTAAKTNDSGWVRIRWNSAIDSVRVVVHLLNSMSITPSILVMVPGEQVTMLVRAEDSGGRKVTLDNAQITFHSTAPALKVDASGLVNATDFGSGTMDATLDTMHVAVPFNFSGNDTSITFETMQTLFPWDTSLVNLPGATVKLSLFDDTFVPNPTALKIAYTVPDTRGEIQLKCNIPLSGRIDSLFLRVYGSGNGDTTRFVVRDKDGDLFLLTAGGAVTWADEWRTLGVMMSKGVPLGTSSLDYPVTLVQVRINIGRGSLSGGAISGTLLLDDLGAHYPLRTVAPQLLFDFESGITGWYTPLQANAAQQVGIDRNASSLVASADQAYQGSYSGKWTFVDDAASTSDWDVRITRNTTGDLGSMLRGSYIGAWVYANGETSTELQTVVRGGNGQICAGPRFPVHHSGWKLIGTKLDEGLFTPYLTSGVITDSGNKFNGFRLRGPNSILSGQTRILYIDKLVSSALTVPTGYASFMVSWTSPLARLHWSVNSEISINRYVIERKTGVAFEAIGAVQGKGNADTRMEYEYVDTPPEVGTVTYRIRQVANDGGQELSQSVQVNTQSNSVGPEGSIPDRFELMQNYPNPFNPTTKIGFRVSGLGSRDVRLSVYDMLGREVAVLADGTKKPGRYEVKWNAAGLSSGVYICRLSAGSFVDAKKMLLLE
jgi:hypothetical protein